MLSRASRGVNIYEVIVMKAYDINGKQLRSNDKVILLVSITELNKRFVKGATFRVDKFYNAGSEFDEDVIVYLKTVPGRVRFETGVRGNQLIKVKEE